MSILLFPDHLSGVPEHLRGAHLRRNNSVLARSFLDLAYAALREEVWTLPRESRAQIPAFSSVYDLSERYKSQIKRLDVSSALLCICQLACFIGHFEHYPDDYPKAENDLVVGFGLGQLASAAVACSGTVVDLIDPAVEAVRLAFRVGGVVQQSCLPFQDSSEADASWSVIVPGTAEEIEKELMSLQTQLHIPESATPYISMVGLGRCNVSGRPAQIKQLKMNSKLFQNTQMHELPVVGCWHAPHIYGDDEIQHILEPREDILKKGFRYRQSLLSSATATGIRATSAESLFEQVIGEILAKCVQWTKMEDTILNHVNGATIASYQILGFATDPMTSDLCSKLQSGTEKATSIRDLSSWYSVDGRPEVEILDTNLDIAIVGMSGRFPGAPDVDALWRLLEEGRQMHQEVPKDRFDIESHVDASGKKNNTSHTPYGCFIQEPGLFDPRFFNMSPREAAQTDPMHRLALVTAYEALEMSGFVLNGTPSTQQDRVGTFYGQTSDDWREVNAAQHIETYFIPGGVRAFAPGRINYHFRFRGPSYSIDTACSSSLAAIQVACTSLRTGECDTAIAGGVNVLTAPDIFAGLSRGQFLSKTGSCKTWDSKADGYCRADGVGSIVLKRLKDAIADKDNILGTVLGAATNHSADAVSITHPHAGNQSYLYEGVMHSAGINPLDVSFVELHGTGTQAGDLTEMRSVTDVFAPKEHGRSRDQPLYIGAIKANVGHGEAAAGVSALIKLLLMFQKHSIPPHVGIQNEVNPGFPNLEERNVRIPFEKASWETSAGTPRLAFLNNFSAAGGNTAMLLQERPPRRVPLDIDPRHVLPFVISSKSRSSLQRNIQELASFTEQAPAASFASLSYTLTSRRMHHSYRVGLAASNLPALRSSLLAMLNEPDFAPISSTSPEVVFVFTGQGAFYQGLGKDLYELSLVFRSELERLNGLATAQRFPSFLPAIEGGMNEGDRLAPLVTQLALVCIQMALVKLWQSYGIRPSAVIGHSVGEFAALNAAGVLSSDDTIHLVGSRAQLLQEKCAAGTHAMVAVKASLTEITTVGKGLHFEVACLNTPTDTVLSAPLDDIKKLSHVLNQAGYKNTILNLPYAFHSAQMDDILEDLENVASGAIFNRPNIPVISPLLGQVVTTDEVFSPAYICRHARETVDFSGAVQAAVENDTIKTKAVFVELGPHPVCSNMIKAILMTEVCTLPSLRKRENAWKTVSESLCSLHCAGLQVDWRQFHQGFESSHELLNLPTYRFDNKNYWIDYTNDWCLYKIEPRNPAPDTTAGPVSEISTLSTSSVHRVLSEEFDDDTGTMIIQSDLAHPVLRAAVAGHVVNGASLCPSSLYADICLTLGSYVYDKLRPNLSCAGVNCADMEVMKPLIAKKDQAEQHLLRVKITADLKRNMASLRYYSVDAEGKETILHATCTVTYEDRAPWATNWDSNAYLIESRIETLKGLVAKNKADQISRGLAYKLFSAAVQYDPKFQGMEEVIFDSTNFEATSRVNFQTDNNDGTFFCSPFWIDSLAHLSGFILNASGAVDSKNFVYISHGWKSMRFARSFVRTTTYNAYVKMQPSPNNIMVGDVYILEGDTIIGVVGGLKFQRIPRKMLDSILPPSSSAAPKPAALPIPAKRTPVSIEITKADPPKAPSGRSQKKPSTLPNITAQAMELIARESDLPLSELQDDCAFSTLGVDSLLSLQITGQFREVLDIDVPSSAFVDCPTVGELRAYLQKFDVTSRDSSVSSTSSDDDAESESPHSPASSVPSVLSIKPQEPASTTKSTDGRPEDTMMIFRRTIAEQMDIPLDEVVGSCDLLSLGMESLMSISILGILREQTTLELPPTLFQEYPSIDAIQVFLDLGKSEDPSAVEPSVRKQRPKKPTILTPTARALSILLQGKPKTSTKTLFLFPDGSGSATSYASLPPIDPSIAVYGLNSPFMTKPSDFTNGIEGVSALYLDEVRKRQPHGPYYLGGWSAGGVVAYEVSLQLMAAGERVDKLVLLDSPCPIELEALPSHLHHFFAEIGLLGQGGREVPPWLLPHFEASIKALTAYKPVPIADRTLVPQTLAIWARHGVCRYPEDPRPKPSKDEPKSMKWLLENRTDFGFNGWDTLLGAKAMETTSLDGNHFNLMSNAMQLREISRMIRGFL